MNPADRYDSLFTFYGRAAGVDPMLLKAQIKQESGFNPAVTNKSSGAMGLAQFMPATWKEWGKAGSPFNPEAAISAQARYMHWLFGFFKDRPSPLEFCLAAYNWGIGNVTRLLKGRPPSTHYIDVAEKMPAETRDYVLRIMRYYREYSAPAADAPPVA